MKIVGVAYPYALGVSGKNKLEKEGGSVSAGRWINTNNEDWSKPNWKLVPCRATLVDRSLSMKPYTIYDTDVAVFTEYEDPSINMIMYDLVPVNSLVFEPQKPPPEDLNASYDWTTIEGRFENMPQRLELPQYPMMIMAIGLAAIFTNQKRDEKSN